VNLRPSVAYNAGDLGPALLLILKHLDTQVCPPSQVVRDLADSEVRASYYKVSEYTTPTGTCQYPELAATTVALFYRILTKVPRELLASTVAIDEVVLQLQRQPRGPQRLRLRVTAVTTPGSLTISGLDEEGGSVIEVVPVLAPGDLLTTLPFTSVDIGGLVVAGEFTFSVDVFDGQVLLEWQVGDLETPGVYALVVEELVNSIVVSAVDPMLVHVAPSRARPAPTITSVTPEPVAPLGILSIVGTGLLDLSAAILIDQTTLVVTPLIGLTVANDTGATATVPGATPVGSYDLRVIGPGGTATYSTATVI
jgi:hypothetical protein